MSDYGAEEIQYFQEKQRLRKAREDAVKCVHEGCGEPIHYWASADRWVHDRADDIHYDHRATPPIPPSS